MDQGVTRLDAKLEQLRMDCGQSFAFVNSQIDQFPNQQQTNVLVQSQPHGVEMMGGLQIMTDQLQVVTAECGTRLSHFESQMGALMAAMGPQVHQTMEPLTQQIAFLTAQVADAQGNCQNLSGQWCRVSWNS